MKNLLFIFLLLFSFTFAHGQDENASVHYQNGIVLLEKMDFEASLLALQKAEKMLVKDKSLEWINCKLAIADNLFRQAKFEESKRIVDELLLSKGKYFQEKSQQNAELYLLQGELFLHKGENDKALENMQASLTILEKHYNEDRKAIAQVYNNLGLIYWNTRKQNIALDHLLKALDLRKILFGDLHAEIADSYNNIGLIYSQSGDNTQALTYYEKAVEIYQKVLPENHPKLANAYTNLAIIFWQQGKYFDAIRDFEEALKIYEQVYGVNHVNVAFVFNYIAQVKIDQVLIEDAKNYAHKALNIYEANYGLKHPEIAKTYNLLGRIALLEKKGKRKNCENALTFFQKALIANAPNFNEMDFLKNPNLADHYDANVLLRSLLLKSRAFEELYAASLRVAHLNFSLEILDDCDNLVTKIRQTLRAKGDQIALSASASEVHEDAIRISLLLSKIALRQNFYLEKAFDFAEKSKSAALLSAISDTDAKSFANIPANLLLEEKKLKENIALFEQKLAEKPTANEESEFRNKLFDENKKYNDFIQNLETQYPEYYNLKYNIKLTSVAEIQAILPENAALISYFIAEKTNRLLVFQITKNKISVEDVPQSQNFKQNFVGLRNGIKFKNAKLYLDCAFQLHQQLFPQRIAKSIKQLIIIPDGILGSIPFEALLTNEVKNLEVDYRTLPYLLNDFSVNYAFSASLYAQNIKKIKPKNASENSIFVCAPINFKGNRLGNLPATEIETELICAQFEGKSFSLTYNNAKEVAIKSGILKKYAYLHFATHGTVNENSPELSRIFLAADSLQQEDGSLYAGEIYNLELNADLVTLSACETGLGKLTRGEGIIGLSRAFFYAGAKNLVVSLWTVADQSTADLMIDFYTNIKKK